MNQQATPYFIFNGNAKEALEFYKNLFQAEITNVQTFGEADFPTPPEMDDKIMHARLEKGSLLLMFSDAFQNQTVEVGNNISLALEFTSEKEIQAVYQSLSKEGTVMMELQDTFWGAKFAKVKDIFGVIWDLNFTKQS
ncbi:VOC family protein [Metabacillus sp. HB246100]|uniref:VOC family protein n=1 Tax=Bacillus weihaiensis TaxID=1547283 RepID=UPI0023521B6C|nr:glyoxalase/bleomycin resistance/extradiol dioxygenase family protein [Bacillus weihaiensis]